MWNPHLPWNDGSATVVEHRIQVIAKPKAEGHSTAPVDRDRPGLIYQEFDIKRRVHRVTVV